MCYETSAIVSPTQLFTIVLTHYIPGHQVHGYTPYWR